MFRTSFLACDRLMVEFFQWVAELPQLAWADEPDPDSPCLEPVTLWKERAVMKRATLVLGMVLALSSSNRGEGRRRETLPTTSCGP